MMLTRMEITYRSKEQYSLMPEVFSTGGYGLQKGGKTLNFDFLNMEAHARFEGGYMYMDCIQKNLDEDLIENMSLDEVYQFLKTSIKEDFTEIYYECYKDLDCNHSIELVPMGITFYDFSTEGDGKPIEVGGEAFSNLS